MTAYVNLRSASSLGPDVLFGDPNDAAKVAVLRAGDPGFADRVAKLVTGRDVLLAIHGFNVSYSGGLQVLAQFERAVGLRDPALFLGVLWPGDFVVPVINYPFEASDAVRHGKVLATFCDRWLAGRARSISIVSHSLGGRVALEAARHSSEQIRSLCLTAGAVDDDCLTGQYSDALENCRKVHVLSSTKDVVLRLAYPAGDFLSDIFGDSDSPFRGALGLHGPKPSGGPTVWPHPIPADLNCGHTDYLSDKPVAANVAGYVGRAFAGADYPWV